MRRSRSPASSYCSASGRDNSDWDVWAFKVKLRLRSGTPYLALEVSAAQKGSAFARDGYLHQSPEKGLLAEDGAGGTAVARMILPRSHIPLATKRRRP